VSRSATEIDRMVLSPHTLRPGRDWTNACERLPCRSVTGVRERVSGGMIFPEAHRPHKTAADLSIS
jgi:hypothetical protein